MAAVEIPFPDHHAYTEREVRDLLALKEEKNCAAFVTTEKDVINLREHAPRLQPLFAASVTMELVDAVAAMSLLEEQFPTKKTAV